MQINKTNLTTLETYLLYIRDSQVPENTMDDLKRVYGYDPRNWADKALKLLSELKPLPRFSVIEYSSFYTVRDNTTGKEKCMGDGVDTLFDMEEKAISPGTEEFIYCTKCNCDMSMCYEDFPEYAPEDLMTILKGAWNVRVVTEEAK